MLNLFMKLTQADRNIFERRLECRLADSLKLAIDLNSKCSALILY